MQRFVEKLKPWLPSVPLAALVILFLAHFTVVATYAVNVPFWDEWAFFDKARAAAFPDNFSFGWLLPQANEHRIVPTKLLIWTLLRLDGWNIVTNQLINFILYGVIIVGLIMFARRMVPGLPRWITAGFLIFLLSPINYANHFWAIQSCVRFSVLFFLFAVYFLFDQRQRNSSLLLGSLMAILAVYSFFSGLVAVSVLVLLFGLFKTVHIFERRGAGERRKELAQLAMVILPVAGAIGVYFIDYQNEKSPLVLPNRKLFWTYLLDLYSWGFGFFTSSSLLGLLCLLLVVTPIVGQVWRNGWRLPSSTWAVFSFSLGIMAIMVALTGGRADGSFGGPKISRYAEYVMMLVPFTAFAWSIFLQNRRALRKYLLIGLWSFCFLGYANDWLWFRVYSSLAQERLEGVNCIKGYYEHGGELRCPTISPWPIAGSLERAKQVDASFYREIKEGGSH